MLCPYKSNPDLGEHHWPKLALILFNVLIYVAMVGFNMLATFENSKNTLFTNTVGSVSDILFLEITPAGWVFSIIWTTIFIWNFLWLVYAVANIWRRCDNGDLLYRRINFFPWGLFVAFTFNNLSVIAWLFVWDSRNLGWSLFLITLAVISVDICVLIVARRAHYKYNELNSQKRKFDIVAIRLALNGLGFYATWLSLATNLNAAQFLTYTCGIGGRAAETMALVAILIVVVAYFVIENFVWPRFFLFMFAPWIVVNLALAGSLVKNWDDQTTRNKVITLVLASLTVLFAFAKIGLFVAYRTVWTHRLARPTRVHSIQTTEMTNKKANKTNNKDEQIESL